MIGLPNMKTSIVSRGAASMLFCCLALFAEGASAKETVVVLPTAHSSNIRANEATKISSSLTNTLKQKGFEVWGRQEIDVRIGFDNIAAMGDCFAADCTKSVAEALDAKAVIVSRINRLGSNYILVLLKGDRSGKIEKVSIKGNSASNCAKQIPGLLNQLFGNTSSKMTRRSVVTPQNKTPSINARPQSGTPKIGLGLQAASRVLLGRTLQGLTVTKVVPGGLAARAGISVGDYITKLNNVSVPDVATFGAILKSANGTLIAQVVKINAMVATPVTLLGTPPMANTPSNFAPSAAPAPATKLRRPKLGLALRFTTKKIAGYRASGMEVKKVVPGGKGAQAGLQAGDFIREINGQAIRSGQDFKRLYQAATNQLSLVYIRNGLFGPQRTVIPFEQVSAPSAGVAAQSGQWSGSGKVQFGNQNTNSNYQAPKSQTTNDYSLGKGGVGFSTETITQNTEPIDSASFLTWSLGYNGSFSDSSTSNGLLVGLGFRNLDPSGFFPGPEGGSRSALDTRLNANLMVQATSIDFGGAFDPFGDGDSSSSSMSFTNINLLAQGGLAYTSISFDPVDEETLTQSGFAWSIGLGLAATINVSSGSGSDDDDDDDSFGSSDSFSTSSDYGPDAVSFAPAPIFGIEFPKLNPGTASLSSFQISGFILPIGGLNLALNIGGSF